MTYKIAVIPARGGSKRIPRKNIKLFRGKEIIRYSIEAALQSKLFDRIIVSTDDQEIAELAKLHGAEIPFVRPANLSDDHTGTDAVVKHCIQWLSNHADIDVDFACCIYATAPFIRSEDIRRSYKKLYASNQNFCIPVTSFPFPIHRSVKLNANKQLEPFFAEHIGKRSQDLEEAFHDAGHFYWGTSAAFRNDEEVFARTTDSIVIPRHIVQDIDTLEDWQRAELMHEALENFSKRRMGTEKRPDELTNQYATV